MDILLRAVAILIEVVILASIIYALVKGMQLILSDLGLGATYNKVVIMVMVLVGCMTGVFFIAHLISFYPTI